MITVRPAETRGRTRLSWLDSRHSFSFGDYYDPRQTGFGPLLVINEDRVAPGAGFPTHGHRDMEIISYVLDGALEHKDSSIGSGTGIGSITTSHASSTRRPSPISTGCAAGNCTISTCANCRAPSASPPSTPGLGVLFAYVVRQRRLLLLPVAVMVVSVLTQDGHFLVDVIAGAAVAAAAVWLTADIEAMLPRAHPAAAAAPAAE